MAPDDDRRHDVDLVPKLAVSGVVRGAETGAPVPDAAVVLTDERGAPLASARTGPDGGYHLDGLPRGTDLLSVSAVLHHDRTVQVPADGDVDNVLDVAVEERARIG